MTIKTLTSRITASIAAAVVLSSLFLTSSTPAFAAATSADGVLGQGGSFATSTPGTSTTTLRAPRGSVVDGSRHRLFVIDSNNNRIEVFNLNTNNTLPDDTADFVLGQPSFTSTATNNSASGLNAPNGIALDPVNNRLYVSEQGTNRVVVYDASNISTGMNASFVIGQSGFGTSASALTQSGFAQPSGVALSGDNRYLFVSEISNRRVMVFDTNGLANGMNASFVIGQSSFTTNVANQNATGMDKPNGVAVDPSTNRLFVSDYNTNRVQVFDLNNLATGMSATYAIGRADLAYASSAYTNLLNPSGITIGNGKVFIADTGNNRVLAYSSSFSASDPAPTAVFGQPDYVTTTQVAVSGTSMSAPNGVYLDPFTYKLYVGDSSFNRVLIFDTTKSGFQVTSVVDPIFTFSVVGRSTTCNGQSATGFKTTATGSVVSLGSLSVAAVTSAAQDLSVSSNAAGGFSVFVKTTGAATNPFSDGNGHSIADVSGTASAPGAAPTAGTPGFGFTSSDTATPFTSNTWAKLTNSNGLIVFGPASTSTKSACVGFSAAISTLTSAGTYSAPVVYSAVPTF